MLNALYILTDANGFTTACDATREALFTEAGRLPLLSPITIDHWIPVYDPPHHTWKHAANWLWHGGETVA